MDSDERSAELYRPDHPRLWKERAEVMLGWRLELAELAWEGTSTGRPLNMECKTTVPMPPLLSLPSTLPLCVAFLANSNDREILPSVVLDS